MNKAEERNQVSETVESILEDELKLHWSGDWKSEMWQWKEVYEYASKSGERIKTETLRQVREMIQDKKDKQLFLHNRFEWQAYDWVLSELDRIEKGEK